MFINIIANVSPYRFWDSDRKLKKLSPFLKMCRIYHKLKQQNENSSAFDARFLAARTIICNSYCLHHPQRVYPGGNGTTATTMHGCRPPRAHCFRPLAKKAQNKQILILDNFAHTYHVSIRCPAYGSCAHDDLCRLNCVMNGNRSCR